MPPRDIASLVDYLIRQLGFCHADVEPAGTVGPGQLASFRCRLLPPRLVHLNQDTIERVYYRTVAAEDGTRHSPQNSPMAASCLARCATACAIRISHARSPARITMLMCAT